MARETEYRSGGNVYWVVQDGGWLYVRKASWTGRKPVGQAKDLEEAFDIIRGLGIEPRGGAVVIPSSCHSRGLHRGVRYNICSTATYNAHSALRLGKTLRALQLHKSLGAIRGILHYLAGTVGEALSRRWMPLKSGRGGNLIDMA